MARYKLWLAVLVISILILGFTLWQKTFRDDFKLPVGGETSIIEEEILVIEDQFETKPSETKSPNAKPVVKKVVKKIMLTDGLKHSVPLEEILSGGPPKDGIPSIDNPKFISIKEADKWLDDKDPGIAFSKNGVDRFYPYQIIVWHEIVNDTIKGDRVLVTYCPLCLTGFVLDPVVEGERVEFGTSGKLWKSNLVMYDRKTGSLWSQVLAEAIVGPVTGTKLKILPSDQLFYGNWKKTHSNGEVLSRETGAVRTYGFSPYGDYFSATNLALSLVGDIDKRLKNDAFIFGIMINDKAKAYSIDSVKKKGIVEDNFEGKTIVLRYDEEADVVRMFKKSPSGVEERINPISGFWFSWAAAHPDTELYE